MSTELTRKSRKSIPIHLMLLTLGGFLLASTTLRCLTPMTDAHGVREKFAYFEKHKDEFHVLIFGSSRVYRSFIPLVIEEELRKQGIEMRIFNFGNPAMGPYEADYMMREALALNPDRLKWVIMELTHWRPDIMKGQFFTDRNVRWHTFQELRNAFESVAREEQGLLSKITMGAHHLLHWTWKQTAYGCGRDILDVLWNGIEEPPYLARWQGYRPLEDEEDPEVTGRRKDFLEHQAQFDARLKNYVTSRPKDDPISTYNLGALERQQKVVREANAKMLYVILPSMKEVPQARGLVQDGLIPFLLVYNKTFKYPEYYQAENLFDDNHLNSKTAELFSRRFAADFADYLTGKGKE